MFHSPITQLLRKVEGQKKLLMTMGSKINVSHPGDLAGKVLAFPKPRVSYQHLLICVQRFVLVGGFGESPYLTKVLNAWCTTNNICKFYRPDDWFVVNYELSLMLTTILVKLPLSKVP